MNAIIVDFPDLSLYNLLHDIKEINISAICVPFEKERNQLKETNANLNIYTWDDVVTWNQTHVSVNDINKDAHTQLKVDRYYARYSNIYGVTSSLYYHSLAFWNHILNDDISVIFIADQEHGIPVDSIPLSIAKEKGILAYTFEPIFAVNEDTGLYSIHNYNRGYYVDISDAPTPSKNIDISNTLFSKDTHHQTKKHNNTKKILSTLSISLKKKYLSKKKENYFGIPRDVQIVKSLSNIMHLWRIKLYYNMHSIKKIPKNDKYVLYALHFEPEATIMNRTTFNSQIHNIEMLSKALPEGWTLYVKEHPDQLHIDFLIKNKFIDDNLSTYRSKLYYNRILTIPNVKLLDYRIPSSKLMDSYNYNRLGERNGLKAVATINGTISIEAIHRKIPVILFDKASMPYNDINDIPVINSYEDLYKYMKKIESPNFSPTYHEYNDKVSKYLISYSRNVGFSIESTEFERVINKEFDINNNGEI